MSAPSAVQTPSRPKMDTKTMVSIAMLTGIAYIVMLLSKLMPSVMFLDFDFKDVVVCIGGFTFGPFAAAIISILVAFIEMLTISHTGPIGFIMNVLATCAFSCTACFIYKKVHSKKGAVLGLACGVACLVAVMLLWNYLITPLYMTGYSRADVAGLLPTLFLPFNLAKGGMNHGGHPAALPPGGVRHAESRSGALLPEHPGEADQRRIRAVCPVPAGHLRGLCPGAGGRDLNKQEKTADRRTVRRF